MVRFVLVRLLSLVGILVVLVTVVFALQSVIPSDPARTAAGAGATPALLAAKRRELGVDKPLATQYVDYLGRALRGDLSTSSRTRNPVTSDLRRAFPASLELLLAALVIAFVLGTGLGVAMAGSARGVGAARTTLVAGASVPPFCLGFLALLFLYSDLRWFPGSGRLSSDVAPPPDITGLYTLDGLVTLRLGTAVDALWHLAMPAVCLALGPALVLARTMRSSLMSIRGSDYVRTARAKGLTERGVMWRHCVRNALNAPLSIAGLETGAMLAGIAVVESVFSWPGIGLYTVASIQAGDFPAIAGVTLLIGVTYVVINVLIDVAQVVVDPRLRAGAGLA